MAINLEDSARRPGAKHINFSAIGRCGCSHLKTSKIVKCTTGKAVTSSSCMLTTNLSDSEEVRSRVALHSI